MYTLSHATSPLACSVTCLPNWIVNAVCALLAEVNGFRISILNLQVRTVNVAHSPQQASYVLIAD